MCLEPSIYTLAGSQQTMQVRISTTTRFRTGKTRGNPDMYLGEFLRPLHDLGRGRLGSGEGGMLVLLHELLLSCETSAVGSYTNKVSHLKVKLVTCVSGILKKTIAQLIKCNCSACVPLPSVFPPQIV